MGKRSLISQSRRLMMKKKAAVGRCVLVIGMV